MTREDAICSLKWHKDDLTAYDTTVKEAIDMAIEALQREDKFLKDLETNTPTEPRGVYQCFHCGSQSVVWQSDFSFEDYGLDGEGIINVCHCTNCGAHIEYYINLEEDDENEREETI